MIVDLGIKVLIFDFDGVIVESNGIKDRVFEKIFSLYPEYFEEMMIYHKDHVSESRVKKFDHLLNIANRESDDEWKESLMKDFSDFSLELMESVSFVAGAIDLLNAMAHMPLYIASVTPINDLEIILNSLSLRTYFEDVYGCPPWTKPDAVNDILKRENIKPGQAILIGDSAGDQRTAKVTGVHFIARNSGLPFDEAPERLFSDLKEISQYFNA
jgi:phosphoglycolate phosphatase-like HAD superfamily hydrolase